MSVLVLPGSAGLSAFRLQRLKAALLPHVATLTALSAREFFLVDHADGLDVEALRRLLEVRSEVLADAQIWVVPRLGTFSPWSSKASDIARVCGLAGVRRIERGWAWHFEAAAELPAEALGLLHDPMTESVLFAAADLQRVFGEQMRRPLRRVDVLHGGRAALAQANRDWGLALSDEEIDYLTAYAQDAGRQLTDAELMMFAQVNSEHCRHKIFNAEFTVDGELQPHSLFAMIRMTHAAAPEGVLSAYRDNASVIAGPVAPRWFPDGDAVWRRHEEPVHILMKVETHNHPTGISPFPGAATGAGGEIRDEAATGLGGKPKAGMAGFAVANLRIPALQQPWEADLPRPPRMASALDIMIQAPLGAAAYNNEFGRPNLNGYFRTLELITPDGRNRGFHKPIMIAGGYGNVRAQHVEKKEVVPGTPLIVLGGPAMLIGLGGGAASSMATGASTAELDFASVQRANPELERRCQEVVDACWALGDDNPILSIHDVGAGGVSNALPELVHADGRGGLFHLRDIQAADPALSPMEIWCNEAQERYVIALQPQALERFAAICARERCPHAVVGVATAETLLQVTDALSGEDAVNLPMPVLLGKPPRMKRSSTRAASITRGFATGNLDVAEAVRRVLSLPSVASKEFLITIGDRSVGGLTVRDQMVGPWQVPVADCAVTATGFESTTGEAMAVGERPALALIDAAASARIAVGEAITNIASAHIARLGDVRLSANWMAACGQGDEDARLFDAVKAVGQELCPALGLAIPVGKDSLSMKAVWQDAQGATHTQTAPVSLVVTAFASVADVRRSLTPQLRTDAGPTGLLLLDLGNGRNRLGGSALAQVYGEVGDTVPDLDQPQQLASAFALVQQWNGEGRLLACHDRGDGGLLASVCEMAFAGHCGVDIDLSALGSDPLAALFSEELGLILQLRAQDLPAVRAQAQQAGLHAVELGAPSSDDRICFRTSSGTSSGAFSGTLFADGREALHKLWARTSFEMAALRDDPDCAAEAYTATGAGDDPGLRVALSFAPESVAGTYLRRPRVAILREQGVNSQAEMAWAFDSAGFETVDVHMSDLLEGRVQLSDFTGLAACGGFSYGDVLGAGQGWARSILFHDAVRAQFAAFLAHPEKFALGVCNGCQMFAALAELVPGSQHWPMFHRNRSEQFEARWAQVEIVESRSVLFAGMAGSRLPIAVSHGEGRAEFASPASLGALQAAGQMPLRYLDPQGGPAQRYPHNPNGSPDGLASVCNTDGRISILMPHPERSVHGVVGSWWPEPRGRYSPWFRMFQNARRWVG